MFQMDPRKMQKMMKRLGIKAENVEGVERVIFELSDRDLIIEDPQVIKTVVPGGETYQVMGKVEERIKIPTEDVEMVAEQADASIKEAREVLEETNGDLAKAIMKLKKT